MDELSDPLFFSNNLRFFGSDPLHNSSELQNRNLESQNTLLFGRRSLFRAFGLLRSALGFFLAFGLRRRSLHARGGDCPSAFACFALFELGRLGGSGLDSLPGVFRDYLLVVRKKDGHIAEVPAL